MLLERLQSRRNFPTNTVGACEGEGILFVDRSPRTQLVAEFAFQARGIHAGGLPPELI
jgi:hypothetical protein